MNSASLVRTVALLLTALTGFSGLVYEVAWQRYLATLLGAQSEATAAVLGIFLGGLSAGYALFGWMTRRLVMRAHASARRPSLLAAYGLIETAIGVYALLFPWLFRGAQQVSLALPTGGGLAAFAADVVLAAALIAPPAVLMGATIPILTQALARDLVDATRLHALVYATNTAGAFAGALAAGFALVPWLGLDGVARAMGVINLGAGAGFVLLGTWWREIATPAGERAQPAASGAPGARVYGAAALLIGFGSMTCQAILIRLGGLALGSSEFTFAMVVAGFVFAIAAGSLAVSTRPRIGRAALPMTLWALALAFGLLYTRADEAPYWGHVLRTFFSSTPETFYVYYGAAFFAALLAIGPPAALSGAALPLIFDAVREEMGELGAKAGRLYSYNTIGSLFGALIGGYALLFWLDLHHVFRIALAGFALAAAIVTAHRHLGGSLAGTAALVTPALIAIALLPPWDPARLSSGLFRTRTPQPWSYRGPDDAPKWPLLFHDDDPTHTVAVVGDSRASGPVPAAVSLLVNGKPDGNTLGDLDTMALAALLPALFADRAERAFVIGYGTGITAGYLAQLDAMRSVTVAEISRAVLRAAPLFDFANHGASHHPKIEVVRSDAYRALLRSQGRFDVIVSEPSNPWAAGIEMLFSREFLSAARDRLSPGGVYVQWYHLYENSDRAVELVLQTYGAVFDEVAVWRSQSADLLLLGLTGGDASIDLAQIEQRLARPDLRAAFARIGITGLPELLVHEVVPPGVWRAARRPALPLHTLVHPRLSYEAGRGFFTGALAELPFLGVGEPARIGARNSLLARYLGRFDGSAPDSVWNAIIEHACRLRLPECPTWIAAWAMRAPPDAVRERIRDLRAREIPGSWLDLVPLLRFLLGDTSVDLRLAPPADTARDAAAYFAHYAHAVPFQPRSLSALWRHCREQGEYGAPCERGRTEAMRFATTGEMPAWAR